jgi:hypothetical protein
MGSGKCFARWELIVRYEVGRGCAQHYPKSINSWAAISGVIGGSMKKVEWMKTILAVSLFVNVALFMNTMRVDRNQEFKFELLNAYIYRDLAQLEATIQYQVDHHWENEDLVTQKVDDAMDSIILHIGMERDNDKREVLWQLHDYMIKFRIGDEYTKVSLTEKQRADYIDLGEKLRTSGWTFHAGIDTSWDAFSSRVAEFVEESQ